MILGILAHEIGHLSYGHTVIQLLIGGGNIFISGCLLLIKISYWIFSAIMGLFAICSRSGVMGIITAVFAGISTALSWLRSEEHTSELQSRFDLVCRLLLE